MDEETVAAVMLPVAIRAAKKLWADPEAESIAGEACIKAMRSYDGRGTLEGHVARCTRVHIYHTWRKVKVRSVVQHSSEHVAQAVSYDDQLSESPLNQEQWQILCEKFELGWPFDVVAKRHNMSTRAMKRLIPELIELLEKSL